HIFSCAYVPRPYLHSFPTRRSSDLGLLSDYEIGRKGRIAEPLHLPAGASHYQPIGWDDAFRKIGLTLRSLSSPDEAVFYTSGRTDRKSTRLNSSHVKISYAVFCLKK